MSIYYHGGAPGIKKGELLLPPSITGAASCSNYGAGKVCRKDRVYVTIDRDTAYTVACLHPSGKGRLYEVIVGNVLEDDPDSLDGHSFQTDKAMVVHSTKAKGKDIKKVRKQALGY